LDVLQFIADLLALAREETVLLVVIDALNAMITAAIFAQYFCTPRLTILS
jgi:hypothetical protein